MCRHCSHRFMISTCLSGKVVQAALPSNQYIFLFFLTKSVPYSYAYCCSFIFIPHVLISDSVTTPLHVGKRELSGLICWYKCRFLMNSCPDDQMLAEICLLNGVDKCVATTQEAIDGHNYIWYKAWYIYSGLYIFFNKVNYTRVFKNMILIHWKS